jgi:hypothetical protein
LRSRTTLRQFTDTKTVPRGSRTLLHLSHFSTSFMHLHLLYSITITGTPETAVTIQHRTSRQGSTHVYKIALLLFEKGIDRV